MSRPAQALNQERLREIDARGRRPLADKFWEKVDVRGPDECWPWLGAVTRGRGGFGIDRNHMTASHRIAVALSGRDIPAGMHIDHICRNGLCQNPKHLRVVTPTVNTMENNSNPWATNRAKTHCKYGHEFTPENTQVITYKAKNKRGELNGKVGETRVCVVCDRRRRAIALAKHHAKKAQQSPQRDR